MTEEVKQPEYTGKDVSYYTVEIPDPKRLMPYTAECEDIIEALGMTFAEGCAFKGIWRRCAARTLGKQKAGYKGGLYDAEKTVYYGQRMVAADKRIAGEKTGKYFTQQEAPAPVNDGVEIVVPLKTYDADKDVYTAQFTGEFLKTIKYVFATQQSLGSKGARVTFDASKMERTQ